MVYQLSMWIKVLKIFLNYNTNDMYSFFIFIYFAIYVSTLTIGINKKIEETLLFFLYITNLCIYFIR